MDSVVRRKYLDICRANFDRIQGARRAAYPLRYVSAGATQKPVKRGPARREGSSLADFRRTPTKRTAEGTPASSFDANWLKSEPSNVKVFTTHHTRYKIFETDQFVKDLEKDFSGQKNRIKEKLLSYVYPQLREQPFFGKNIKKLVNFNPDTWRYRIGDHRFFYCIDENRKIVFMLTADNRSDAY